MKSTLRYAGFALAAVLLAVLPVAAGPARAAAAVPTVQLTLPVGYPDGVALDALGWGGTGTPASCATGAAAVNDEVAVWRTSAAGCAADFYVRPAAGAPADAAALVQVEYAPDGNISAGLCVSAVTDVERAFARLRPCAAGLNPWQDFSEVSVASDIAGAVELQAEGYGVTGCPGPAPCTWVPYNLNDRGFGKSGSPVISYQPTNGENQLWSIGPSI